jgi:hypothetical protein
VKRALIWIGLNLSVGALVAGSAEAYWQQAVNYTMHVRLNPEEHQVIGRSRIIYHNQSPDTLDRVYLHLYPRAFRKGSVKYREFSQNFGRLGRARGFMKGLETLWHEFSVDSFRVEYGEDWQTSRYKIVDTILESRFPTGLPPGDSIVIEIAWTHTVGEQFERAGYVGEQYNMAQWYPKLVVYDEAGWHPDPFHAEGEFYGEFGTFDVTLDLPARYIVGATGVVMEGDPGWEAVIVDSTQPFESWLVQFQESRPETDSTARRVVRFHAEHVHDFAWIASPTFLYEHGSWNGIDIHVLYNLENGLDWNRVVRERAQRAVAWLSTRFGPYPYPQVTVTDRIRGGGMEYPMLVMNGRESEGLIVHEIGHIWFYGILANNEVDEAWLDEGFTTFQTRWYLETRYPKGIDFAGTKWYQPYQQRYWRFTSRTENDQWSAIRFITSGQDEPISRSSYLFNSGSSYRYNAYTKPSLMLLELKYLLGDSLFLAGMQKYYDRWKLKHVNESRFVDAMEETAGQELDWFFDGWLHDTQILDYGIKSWQKQRREDGSWQVRLELANLGERYLPLEIETKLADGSTVRNRWTNHLWRFHDTFEYTVPGRPTRVRLDPDLQTLDVDYRNNVTGRFPREWVFRWPGMQYNPRDRYVIRWSSSLYYHARDNWMPGVHLSRDYSFWEHTGLKLNYALGSSRLYWYFQKGYRPVHTPGDLRFVTTAFDYGGVASVKAEFQYHWNRKYNVPPNHQIAGGFYLVNAKDTSRTDLYDPGVVTVLYGEYRLSFAQNRLELEMAAAPGGWSDWTFSRLTAVVQGELQKGNKGLRNRLIAGFMWSDSAGVPTQERYTVEGAGSNDRYARHYLRDVSSFYGLESGRARYHLPGDANLRGYQDLGLAGSEKMVATSLEAFYVPNVPVAKVELAGFVDGGIFWGSKWVAGDEGFSGDWLMDAGVGLRVSKNIYGKSFYIRLDVPFWRIDPNGGGEVTLERWVFSFERPL